MAVEAIQLNFNCHECDSQLKRERGCNDKGIVPFDIDGERYFRCPLKLVTDASWGYIEAYKFYKMGLLPNGVIYSNESRKYLDAMNIMDNELAKIEEAKMEQAKKHGRH